MPKGGACIQDEQQLEQSRRFHKEATTGLGEFQTDNYKQLSQHNAPNPTACQGTIDLLAKIPWIYGAKFVRIAMPEFHKVTIINQKKRQRRKNIPVVYTPKGIVEFLKYFRQLPASNIK